MITIAGEEGKTFGPAQIDFAEIGASGSLNYQSLGVDELTFSIEPEYLNAREQEIPEEGQYIELFESSQRIFCGIVTSVQNEWGEGNLSVDVTVSGPFWWLEQTALSEIVSVGSDASERPQFKCEIGGVETHIRRLFDRMQDLGLPVALGEMDACYDIPTTTFQDASFARALSELLRMVPDAVGWFDYSTSGDPEFRVTRRKKEELQEISGPEDATFNYIGSDLGAPGNLKFRGIAESGGKIFCTPYAAGNLLVIDPFSDTTSNGGTVVEATTNLRKAIDTINASDGFIYANPAVNSSYFRINPSAAGTVSDPYISPPPRVASDANDSYLGYNPENVRGGAEHNGNIYGSVYSRSASTNGGTPYVLKFDIDATSTSNHQPPYGRTLLDINFPVDGNGDRVGGIYDVRPNWETEIAGSNYTWIYDSYYGATKAVNGKIYLTPYGADRIVIVDPNTDNVTVGNDVITGNEPYYTAAGWPTGLTNGVQTTTLHFPYWSKYSGGTYVPENGCIYCFPRLANAILKIDTSNDSAVEIPLPSALRIYKNTYLSGTNFQFDGYKLKSFSSVLGPDGKVYSVPNEIPFLFWIDPKTDEIGYRDISVELEESGSNGVEWFSYGVTYKNAIYFAPMKSRYVLKLQFPYENSAELLTLGSDPVTSGSLEAQYSLKIDSVSVPYAERLLDGSILFKEISSGTSSGTRQIVPVSGPELVDFVPPDPIDGVTITTEQTMDNSVQVSNDAIEKLFPFYVWWSLTYPFAVGSHPLLLWSDQASTVSKILYPSGSIPKLIMDEGDVIDISTDNRFAIVDPDLQLPSWFSDVETLQTGRIVGTVYTTRASETSIPAFVQALLDEADYFVIQTSGSGLPEGLNNGDKAMFYEIDIPVTLLDRELINQTFYKPLSYIFETPPADFAENLREAQNWLPYIGSVNLEAENPPFVRKTGSTINLAGGRSVWESMGGLVQGETFDLLTREQSLSLGLPERLTGSTPVTRLERSSSDSLIIL
tara:strand:+ start:744 stop:3734 length:2991 start_codon:yes stop_codon:yes gene_type:complete